MEADEVTRVSIGVVIYTGRDEMRLKRMTACGCVRNTLELTGLDWFRYFRVGWSFVSAESLFSAGMALVGWF